MSKKTRTLLAIVLVELLLAVIWFYLASLGAAQPDRVAPEYQRTLGSTMGAAMGAFFGLGCVLYLVAARPPGLNFTVTGRSSRRRHGVQPPGRASPKGRCTPQQSAKCPPSHPRATMPFVPAQAPVLNGQICRASSRQPYYRQAITSRLAMMVSLRLGP